MARTPERTAPRASPATGVAAPDAFDPDGAPADDALFDAPADGGGAASAVDTMMHRIEATLASLADTDEGRAMRLGLLALFEEIAAEVRYRLPPGYYGLRRRVANGAR